MSLSLCALRYKVKICAILMNSYLYITIIIVDLFGFKNIVYTNMVPELGVVTLVFSSFILSVALYAFEAFYSFRSKIHFNYDQLFQSLIIIFFSYSIISSYLSIVFCLHFIHTFTIFFNVNINFK